MKMYTQNQLNIILKKIPSTKLKSIRHYVKAGYTIKDIVKIFGISENHASVLFLEFTITEKRYISVLGNKDEPYYEGDPPADLPIYCVEDLNGQELLILKWFEDGTYEGTLHGDYGETQS